MSKILKFITNSPLLFNLGNLIIYIFYGLLIGISLIPSFLLFGFISVTLKADNEIINLCIKALSAGVCVYVFLISALIVFSVFEKLFSMPLKQGKYKTDNPVFLIWLIYSGIHTLSLSLILPFVLGSPFIKLYYAILGCKMGKDVFINTVGLHDAYLLEIGDNVVIGGKSDITCHTFEHGLLTLEKIKIGNNVTIGANCYIMPGVSIEDNCNIGANSLIRKNKTIGSNSMMMPIPAITAKEVGRLLNTCKKRPVTVKACNTRTDKEK